jgi:hypothetical protein
MAHHARSQRSPEEQNSAAGPGDCQCAAHCRRTCHWRAERYSLQARQRFAEHDVHLLSTLADSAAIAIRNAGVSRRTPDADRFAALAEIDRRISSPLIYTVLQRIVSTRAISAGRRQRSLSAG